MPISIFQANYFQFFLWWHFPMMSVPLKPILWGVFAFPKTTVVQRVEQHQERVHPVLEFAVYSSKQFLKLAAPLWCKRSFFYYLKKQALSCIKLKRGHQSISFWAYFWRFFASNRVRSFFEEFLEQTTLAVIFSNEY